MNCPACDAKMTVTHTYMAGGRAETRNLRCPACGCRASSVTFLIERPQFVKQRGQGGRGGEYLRAKILKGEVRPPDIVGEEPTACTEADSAQP